MTDTELVSSALVLAQGELKAALFDSKNPFLRNKYASLGAVISASRPVLLKHGLAVLQVARTDGATVSVETRLIHKSGQALDGGTLALPLSEEKGKSKAQVMGSIITYCRRYAWSSVLGIYADADDDGNEPAEAQPEPDNGKSEYIPPQEEQPDRIWPADKKPTEKTRLWVLNKLNAAPGQPNHDNLSEYLREHNHLKQGETVESWPLECLPITRTSLAAIIPAMEKWLEQRERSL